MTGGQQEPHLAAAGRYGHIFDHPLGDASLPSFSGQIQAPAIDPDRDGPGHAARQKPSDRCEQTRRGEPNRQWGGGDGCERFALVCAGEKQIREEGCESASEGEPERCAREAGKRAARAGSGERSVGTACSLHRERAFTLKTPSEKAPRPGG